MRYTTIIDITENPELWRNANASRVYLYMALRSGYHDDDRDLMRVSVRRLALETGCSVAATRYALRILEKYKLLQKEGEKWRVTKFVLEQKPSPRTQKNTAAADGKTARMMDEQRAAEELALKKRYYLQNASVEELRELLSSITTQNRKVVNGISWYNTGPTKIAIERWIEYKQKS